ncbi:MAG: ComF family protein [Acidimicrobiales bacterium]
MLLPTTCVICRANQPPRSSVCPACVDRLRPPDPVTVPGLDAVVSVLRFDGAGRDLLLALKYGNRRSSLDLLATAMAATVAPLLVGPELDGPRLVTWAPTSARRRRRRGFDQAELLARAVARRLGRRASATLRRTSIAPQTGLDARQRHLGPTFRVLRPVSGHVLLVDDVVTTGATLAAAASALRSAGVSGVIGVTAAATPLKVVP